MKNFISLTLALLLVLAVFSACTGTGTGSDATEKPQDADKKLTVITTIFPLYDFARAVGGEYVDLTMLLGAGAESHTLDPSAQQMMAIQSSDVFMYIGGEDDTWVEQILSSLQEKKITTVTFMDTVELFEEELKEGMVDEGEDEDAAEGEKEYDAHIWTAPKNAIKMVEKVRDTFIAADSSHKAEYTENAEAYIKKLTAVDNQLKETVAAGTKKTIVVADRFPFRYFCEELGLDYAAAYKGCSAAGADSSSAVLYMTEKIKSEKIPVVFYIEFSNEKIADTVCEETGAEKMCLYSCHNVSTEDFNNGVTYVDLMERNVTALAAAL